MNILATFLLSICLVFLSLPVYGGPPAKAGVTRTPIEGTDNWGYRGSPPSTPKITCPGGDFIKPFTCSDSKTGRLHLRDGAGWSCMTSNDSRMTGVGLYTSNSNFDVDSNGHVWGEWKMVPVANCDKDAPYSEYEALVNDATSFWHGTWNGQREFDSDKRGWVGDLKVVGKGVGVDLDGLHFKGTMWITTYTPFPLPYEAFIPYDPNIPVDEQPRDLPEAYFIGTIKE